MCWGIHLHLKVSRKSLDGANFNEDWNDIKAIKWFKKPSNPLTVHNAFKLQFMTGQKSGKNN